MFDSHMHSTVSFDGHDSPECMARAARQMGLKEICFTDHVDYDPSARDKSMVFDLEAYHAAYDGLELPGVVIRHGMEYGMRLDNREALQQDAGKYAYDEILGSVHFVGGVDVYFEEYWHGKTEEQAVRRYLEETLACVQLHDTFDVLAHLTYICKARANPIKQPVYFHQFPELIDEILQVLVRKGKGLEMNTSGVDRCGDFLPAADVFRRFRELGGEIVTVGSDAHTAARVGQYSAEACAILKEIFGYVCTFQNRQPVFHRL